ncbi:hypothetical protein D3C85_1359380 [compost metagenome]
MLKHWVVIDILLELAHVVGTKLLQEHFQTDIPLTHQVETLEVSHGGAGLANPEHGHQRDQGAVVGPVQGTQRGHGGAIALHQVEGLGTVVGCPVITANIGHQVAI